MTRSRESRGVGQVGKKIPLTAETVRVRAIRRSDNVAVHYPIVTACERGIQCSFRVGTIWSKLIKGGAGRVQDNRLEGLV